LKRRITVGQCVFNLMRAGAQAMVLRLVAGRDRALFDSVVYAFHDGPLAQDFRGAGAVVRVLPQHLPFFDPTLLGRLKAHFRRDRVEVVHTHLFGADLHGGMAAGAADLPALATVHSNRPDNWRQRLLSGMVLGRFHHIVAVGNRVSADVAARCPRIASRLLVIHNGVEDPAGGGEPRKELRTLLGLPEGEVLIGTVGRLSPEKAHMDLIEAFRMALRQEPSIRLVIFGEGPMRGPLERRVSRYGLGGRVYLAGSRPEASRLAAGLDIFALPSLQEGLPLSLLEAMAAGVPCIASRVGSIEEAIRDGVSGRLLDPGHPERLAEILVELLRNPPERAALGKQARNTVLQEYGARGMVTAYEQIYAGLAEQRSGSPSS
jgi:glycosyltransferase involved in cell wall biosynthesis